MSEQHGPWRGQRVLVTGYTGFLGGAVARELISRGAEVVGLVHQRHAARIVDSAAGRVRFVHGRADSVFRLHSAMAVHEVTAVFHLADCDASALVQAANLYSRRMPVVTARPIPQLSLVRTEEPHEPRLTVARFGEVFGPGDRKAFRVVPATARESLFGTSAAPADGPARDFVFVRDAARACLLAAEASVANGPEDYSFRSGWLLTERQMAEAVRAAAASHAVEVPDSAPLSNPLGWQPAESLADALGETLAWCRKAMQSGGDGLRAAA